MYLICVGLFLTLLLNTSTKIFSQTSNLLIETTLNSKLIGSKNKNPFWFNSNTNGAIAETTNGLLATESLGTYKLTETSKITAGISLFLHDGTNKALQRNQLFIEYKNKYINVVVGSKNPNVYLQGLSTVNDNFSLSGNARAIPGVLIKASKPLFMFDNFYLDFGLGHYLLTDDRSVTNANVHYKKLGLQWQINSKSSIYGGIEHYAQWNGTSEIYGRQPRSRKDYFDVVMAKHAADGSSDNDILNALGNHLGFYNLKYFFKSNKGDFQFYHQHPFEDGSGTALKNFPDGIWGAYYKPFNSKNHLFKGLLIEYVQTTSQSGGLFNTGGGDNYFNNGIYLSGWTFEKNTIGLPLLQSNLSGKGIYNNRVMAIHVGATATYRKFDFKTKVTLSQNYGTYIKPYISREDAIYSYIESAYFTESSGVFSIQFGCDYSNLREDRLGVGVGYTYSF